MDKPAKFFVIHTVQYLSDDVKVCFLKAVPAVNGLKQDIQSLFPARLYILHRPARERCSESVLREARVP
jgi:hypothetical protein